MKGLHQDTASKFNKNTSKARFRHACLRKIFFAMLSEKCISIKVFSAQRSFLQSQMESCVQELNSCFPFHFFTCGSVKGGINFCRFLHTNSNIFYIITSQKTTMSKFLSIIVCKRYEKNQNCFYILQLKVFVMNYSTKLRIRKTVLF